jgi:uncharacterized protein
MSRDALHFVIKLSKLCNLRCTYCYEFNELANKERIALADLGRMFASIREYAKANQVGTVHLIWHGGEPFLIKQAYYMAIRELEREAFGSDVNYVNVVQTNLTVMSDDILASLQRKSFFDGIGVSFDVYGDQRVDTKGHLRTDTVLENMRRLTEADVPFGAITVLSRNTHERVVDIYRFFDSQKIASRLLPFYRGANASQVEALALSGPEIVDALKAVFDTWLASEHATPVDPLNDYIGYAIAALRDEPRKTYDKQTQEAVFIVNTDGETWGVAETYDPDYRYGNVLREPLDALMSSSGRRRAIAEADARVAKHCTGCPYFGHCPGFDVADATPEQQRVIEESGCPARALISHIIDRLAQASVTEAILTAPTASCTRNDALAVAL